MVKMFSRHLSNSTDFVTSLHQLSFRRIFLALFTVILSLSLSSKYFWPSKISPVDHFLMAQELGKRSITQLSHLSQIWRWRPTCKRWFFLLHLIISPVTWVLGQFCSSSSLPLHPSRTRCGIHNWHWGCNCCYYHCHGRWRWHGSIDKHANTFSLIHTWPPLFLDRTQDPQNILTRYYLVKFTRICNIQSGNYIQWRRGTSSGHRYNLFFFSSSLHESLDVQRDIMNTVIEFVRESDVSPEAIYVFKWVLAMSRKMTQMTRKMKMTRLRMTRMAATYGLWMHHFFCGNKCNGCVYTWRWRCSASWCRKFIRPRTKSDEKTL